MSRISTSASHNQMIPWEQYLQGKDSGEMTHERLHELGLGFIRQQGFDPIMFQFTTRLDNRGCLVLNIAPRPTLPSVSVSYDNKWVRD